MKKKLDMGCKRNIILLLVLCVTIIMITVLFSGTENRHEHDILNQENGRTSEQSTESEEEKKPIQTLTDSDKEIESPIEKDLGKGLTIQDYGRYSGLFMEDGSDEPVSDVMMIIVSNQGDHDVQLAEITVKCGKEDYYFKLTNVAVGESILLLDQNRKSSSKEELSSATLNTCVLFEEPMELQKEKIKVSGLDNMINVENVSGTDINNDVYIYYKYAAHNLYYGGITFRVRIEDGLKAGEIRQMSAAHYNSDGCAVVQVVINE